jgi:hypothetical protein
MSGTSSLRMTRPTALASCGFACSHNRANSQARLQPRWEKPNRNDYMSGLVEVDDCMNRRHVEVLSIEGSFDVSKCRCRAGRRTTEGNRKSLDTESRVYLCISLTACIGTCDVPPMRLHDVEMMFEICIGLGADTAIEVRRSVTS